MKFKATGVEVRYLWREGAFDTAADVANQHEEIVYADVRRQTPRESLAQSLLPRDGGWNGKRQAPSALESTQAKFMETKVVPWRIPRVLEGSQLSVRFGYPTGLQKSRLRVCQAQGDKGR
jgi:hypothetical protein